MSDGVSPAGEPAVGNLNVRWIHGSRSRREPTDPPLQVHRYTDDTVIIRQSKDATFEAPFVFLLLGAERALLLDTGAVPDDHLRRTIDRLVADWVADHPRDGYRLVVAHTHGHGDHVAGDASFAGRPDTVVVRKSAEDVQAFFGFTSWPEQVVEYDLGGRRVELVGIPGHQPASVAVYDGRTGLLFTGDSVLPGRIYVSDMPTFVDSMNRLVEFAEARKITHVLGCHIEMTRRPGRDFAPGALFQPDEVPLQMTPDRVRAVRDAARSVAGRKGVHRFDDFIVYHGMGAATFVRLNGRGIWYRLTDRLTSRR